MFEEVKNKDMTVFRVVFAVFFMMSLAFRFVVVGMERPVGEVSQPIVQETRNGL